MKLRNANITPGSDESRRYRILEVIGEGGFGKVYRARLEGAERFAKEVAIKLLSDADAPDEVLQRFRDESRILGLVRDRAIVTVDPPTRLEGRWAVVMEYVDGMNCRALMKRAPFPPRVALEVVQEVARALDHVYNQPGPDGRPLRLIHRDIKPSNIQITPAGTVKILDFGIARADFDTRESRTRAHIGGTLGYIAPERLQGRDGPAADIYSLGVVLGALLAGRRCTERNRHKIEAWIAEDEDRQRAWTLFEAMTAHTPEARPTAREVEDRCSELIASMPGESLRRWAERNVTDHASLEDDPLVGSVLTETLAKIPVLSSSSFPLHTAGPRRRPALLVALTGIFFLLVLPLAGLVGLAAMGWVFAVSTQPGHDTWIAGKTPPPAWTEAVWTEDEHGVTVVSGADADDLETAHARARDEALLLLLDHLRDTLRDRPIYPLIPPRSASSPPSWRDRVLTEYRALGTWALPTRERVAIREGGRDKRIFVRYHLPASAWTRLVKHYGESRSFRGIELGRRFPFQEPSFGSDVVVVGRRSWLAEPQLDDRLLKVGHTPTVELSHAHRTLEERWAALPYGQQLLLVFAGGDGMKQVFFPKRRSP